MTCGWIKLHRKLLNSMVFTNEGLLKVWVWCLLKANHEEEWVSIKTGRGSTEVKILPGQFIFGRKTASKELKMKSSTLWKRMQKLKKVENLNIESDTHFSLVSIINWNSYQGLKESKRTGKGTGKEQPRNTNKNDKKIYTATLEKFAADYIKYISETFPTKSPKGKNLKHNSLSVLDKLIRIDGFTEDYIFKSLRWAQKDDFWKVQIYSLAGLRKKTSGDLTKFQNLSNAYDKDQPEQAKPKIPVYNIETGEVYGVAINDR